MSHQTIERKKTAWLLYTVLFGMVPIFIRILMSALVNGESIAFFSASDFISLGIVLQVSLLNEVRYHDMVDVNWKHRVVGLSTFVILFYAALYAAVLFSDVAPQINLSAVLYVSALLSFASFVLCWSVYDRMTIALSEGVAA